MTPQKNHERGERILNMPISSAENRNDKDQKSYPLKRLIINRKEEERDESVTQKPKE